MSLLVDLSIETYETFTGARCMLQTPKYMHSPFPTPTHTQHEHTHRFRREKKEKKSKGLHAFSINVFRSQMLTFHQNQPSPTASARMEPSDINITLQHVRLESHKYSLTYTHRKKRPYRSHCPPKI